VEVVAASSGLSGSLPVTWLQDMKQLKHLNLEGNAFTGPLPTEWGTGAAACPTQISLGGNQLSGRLPAEWASLLCVVHLDLSGNQLTGPLPVSWKDFKALRSLQLCSNNFTGLVPSTWYMEMPSIGDLCVDDSNKKEDEQVILSEQEVLRNFRFRRQYGTWCPVSKWNLAPNSKADVHCGWPGITCDPLLRVSKIKLPRCQLSGKLAPEFSALGSLVELDLSNNKLDGPLPAQYSVLNRQLAILDVSSNMLTGPLPSGYGTMRNLQRLSLSKNSLSGWLPSTFVNLQPEELDLCCNKLGGPLPSQWGWISMPVKKLLLCGNRFQGTLPTDWAMMPNLEELSTSSNSLGGELSEEWSALTKLKLLDLSSNELKGKIPEAWTELDRLQQVRMCDNQLTVDDDGSDWVSSWPRASKLCVANQRTQTSWINTLCKYPTDTLPESAFQNTNLENIDEEQEEANTEACFDGQEDINTPSGSWHRISGNSSLCLCRNGAWEDCSGESGQDDVEEEEGGAEDYVLDYDQEEGDADKGAAGPADDDSGRVTTDMAGGGAPDKAEEESESQSSVEDPLDKSGDIGQPVRDGKDYTLTPVEQFHVAPDQPEEKGDPVEAYQVAPLQPEETVDPEAGDVAKKDAEASGSLDDQPVAEETQPEEQRGGDNPDTNGSVVEAGPEPAAVEDRDAEEVLDVHTAPDQVETVEELTIVESPVVPVVEKEEVAQQVEDEEEEEEAPVAEVKIEEAPGVPVVEEETAEDSEEESLPVLSAPKEVAGGGDFASFEPLLVKQVIGPFGMEKDTEEGAGKEPENAGQPKPGSGLETELQPPPVSLLENILGSNATAGGIASNPDSQAAAALMDKGQASAGATDTSAASTVRLGRVWASLATLLLAVMPHLAAHRS